MIHMTEKANGVWAASIGQPEDLTPTSVMNAKAMLDTLAELGTPSFPTVMQSVDIEIEKGRTILRIPLEKEERLYGLGLQFFQMNHRGRTRTLRVNSDPRQDTGESHAPVPFYISTNGYGVFFNTSRVVTMYCGSSVIRGSKNHPAPKNQTIDLNFDFTPVSDVMEIVIPAEGVEMLIFAGNNLLEIVQRYNLYFGGGVLPPKWGLGFWHRVPTIYNASQVLDEAIEYRKRDFPCDVIGLEPGWHSTSYPVSYEWSEDRYPDPKGFIQDMEENHFKVNLWEHAYVSPEASIYPALEPLSCSHTVWAGLAPDYSLPEAREILMDQHTREHLSIGVSGYKLDECDGSELTRFSWMFPTHAKFPSGHDGEQMRQIYGMLLQKMTTDIYRKKGERTYGLVRASSGATPSLPYVLYSDLYDHKEFVKALCNSSFSGLLWSPEVRSAKNADDWARRFQTVCFSPLAMINAWFNGTKPWSFPEVEDTIRKYIKLRMQLIPYFYSAFAKYHFQGVPPFRAMHLEPGYDPASVGDLYKKARGFRKKRSWDTFDDEIGNQYMAGDSILVAPLFASETERLVYLPEGTWYDFETAEQYTGGQFITITAPVDKLPLFVKDGAVIPMMPPVNTVPGLGETTPLEVRHYGTKPGKFMLYDDDGETFEYENGEYRWRVLEVKATNDGRLEGRISPCEEGWTSSYDNITWKYMNR